MTYYIQDISTGKNPIFFNNLAALVKHLEGTCERLHKMTRTQFMQNLADLGHLADEPSGKNFYVAMSDTVNIGLVKDNRLLRCNIFDATHYAKYATEMGD